ncbi:Cytochrome c oxidase subunit IV [bacterium A37T11]|nr:Cytochrome c oxidase subunit IV [bacterium A37T11]
MENHHIAAEGHEGHADGMTKGRIWKVFFILLGITVLEFIIALGLVYHGILEKGALVNSIYITLTLVKAYYIIAFFMHLKFEKFGFILSLGLVFIFIIYFITLMLTEGSYLHIHVNQHAFWP